MHAQRQKRKRKIGTPTHLRLNHRPVQERGLLLLLSFLKREQAVKPLVQLVHHGQIVSMPEKG